MKKFLAAFLILAIMYPHNLRAIDLSFKNIMFWYFMRQECGSAGNFCSPFWWQNATIKDIQKELSSGRNINQVDPKGRTPLMSAIIARKDLDILDFLIKNGADVNHRDKDGKSVLEYALFDKKTAEFLVKKGAKVKSDILIKNISVCEKVEMLEFLLSNGANTEARDEHGVTPLMWVTGYADIEVIKTLLNHGAKATAENNYGDTVLMEAVRNENPLVTELLLQKGAGPTINAQNELYGDTALMNAAFRGNAETVKFLLKYGALVNLKNYAGETPLMKAIENPEILQILLSNGADVNAVSNRGDTALSMAIQRAKQIPENSKYQKSVEILKKKGNNLNIRNKDGKTPLILSFTKPDKLKLLIEQGADVNFPDKEGNTPLMTAVYPVQYESIKVLLENGANPNIANKKGETPLMRHIDDPRATELLINYKANINAQDNNGRTPLYYYVVFGKLEGFKVLMQHKANPNLADKKGFTPLMAAAVNGRTEMVKILLQAGAYQTINTIDSRGKTALSLAKTNEIADILKKYGAK